jgi:SAM-dependent methyltransferase
MTAMELPGYRPSTYGEAMADVYDDWFAAALDTDGAVGFLGPLARSVGGDGARVLELGVGTGRIALPLAQEGLAVTGVDASAAMLAALKAKPGGELVRAVEADMADLPALDGGPFDVAFVAWNSLFNLTSEADQGRCLRAVAGVLSGPDARFVVEAFVPDEGGTAPRDSVEVRTMTTDSVVLAVSRHDPTTQEVGGHYVQFSEAGGVRLRPWYLHYLTPAQLDRLAGAAGLSLVDRWADWAGSPFEPDASPGHVSVYAPSAS